MPFKLAIATVTLGRVAAGHALIKKLQAASEAGYEGVELTYECFADYNSSRGRADRLADRLTSASEVRQLADSLNLDIISLQPFMNYDALQDPSARLEVGKEWVLLCEALGARWLQIPSAVYPLAAEEYTTSFERIAANLCLLADFAAEHSVELAYEAPSWGIAAQTWQDIDKIIKLAQWPNIRHCLDSFHIATHSLYDPKTLQPLSDGPDRLRKSLDELKTLPAKDIAYVQFSDGCSVDLSQPDYPVKDLSQPAFCTWSRNARCHPFDGTLPLVDIGKAFFETGFEGWVAMESFHTEMWEKEEDVPKRWAERGIETWKRLRAECRV
ncbi:hypothetical protein JCM10207_007175 [Rhodosporidiobolus poonsookiae]